MADTSTKTAPAIGAQQPAEPQPRRAWLKEMPPRFAVIGVWVLMAGLFAVLIPQTFLTEGAFRAIFGGQQALVFLSAALLATIIVGEFVDMSVAANFGLAAVLVPVLHTTHGWDIWLAMLAAVVAATLVGIVNALLIVKVGVNTIVVTLGMATFLLGVALGISNMIAVSGLPGWLGQALRFDLLGLPITFYLGLILVLAFAYVLAFTPLGRNMRFVGANREVSRLAGVRVTRIRMGAFVVAGVIAGLGGVIASATTGGFDPNVANMYLLPMFAAAFLGTAILQPGRFNPLGTLVAVYFLATGVLGLQLLGASSWVSNVFYGGVLVIAVTLSTILSKRR